jgi:hypothetical protein
MIRRRKFHNRSYVLPGLQRLLDDRTPEQRRVAIVRFDPEFAAFQQQMLLHKKQRLWDTLRSAVSLLPFAICYSGSGLL